MENFAKPVSELAVLGVDPAATADRGLALDARGQIPTEAREIRQGTASQRPTAAPSNAGLFWFATDTRAFSYSTGTAWVAPSTGGPVVGDFKLSAQTANHSDPAGGTWYLADGSAIPVGEVALIALLGANLPDVRGRSPWARGTHADVDVIGDNDGLPVANRRPKHNTTLTDPGHGHSANVGGSGSSEQRFMATGENSPAVYASTILAAATGITAQAAGGSGGADQPAFLVAGNPFYYGTGA